MYSVGSNVALAPLSVPFKVVVKGTVAWCEVLTSEVSPPWVRLLCGSEDAGSGIKADAPACGIIFEDNGQRLYGVELAAAVVM